MQSRSFAMLLVLGLCAARASAQQLEAGRVITVTPTSGETTLQFRATSAGILTVVVRSTGESDLVLVVGDEDGQPLPSGHSDQDLGGNAGAEQFAVTIPRAGTYQVRVGSWSEGAAPFRIGASWLSFPELETPADPDGAPGRARVMAAKQQTVQDSLNASAGDYWDWFVITAPQAGTLTVVTRSDEADLVLEAYRAGEFGSAAEQSDQDLQDKSGNEALTLTVAAGEKLFFKVLENGGGSPIAYRLQVSFIPD